MSQTNADWPVGSRFDLRDAYMQNPIEVKRVAVKTNEQHVVGEDARGIRHYAHISRIASAARYEKTQTVADDFDDLFGSDEAEDDDLGLGDEFDDLF